MNDPKRAYNDLPRLPPVTDVETRPVLKRCIAARAAVAELRLAGQLIPDQSVLILAIPLLEARDSSEIENIVTTNDALFREASLPENGGDAVAKEALRYRTAIYEGLASLRERPLSTRTAVDICRTVKGIELDIRKVPGTTLRNSQTGDVIYTPPEGEVVLRGLMSNWEQYLNEPSDIDPLVRMAVLHYQFEAIHPFIDGNGRTGRILNILALVQDKLLDLPTLYLSRHILRTRSDYYRLLAEVTTRGAWEPWIVYMLEAVTVTSLWTNAKIRAIRALMDHTADFARREVPRIYSRELIDVIFAKPYCRIADLDERGIAKRQTGSTYLKSLAKLGVLVEEKHWRDRIFVHRKYLDLLASDGHEFEPYFHTGAEALTAYLE